MCTCTGLAALDFANTKFSAGYRATGVGMCTCGRHEVVMKNGVGDLQKGERYVLYIFLCVYIAHNLQLCQHGLYLGFCLSSLQLPPLPPNFL